MSVGVRTHVVPALVVAGLTFLSLPSAPEPHLEAVVDSPDRTPDQTFLTYPEWFLVWSPREYAEFIAREPPSEFPYLGHIDQFWSSYGAVWDVLRDDYPFNFGYHQMVVVIGSSATGEYAIKGLYETLVGRAAEASSRQGPTEEDLYAAKVAQDYVDFIYETPFYKFDFFGALERLWTTVPATGPDLIRKWERRYALTSELAFKGVYAWMIWQGTASTYTTPLLTTTVWLDALPPGSAEALPDLEILEGRAGGGVLVNLPRYHPFTRYLDSLAQDGASFKEIAGNDSVILVTVLTRSDWSASAHAPYTLLFTQPILTEPGRQRAALVVPVPDLGDVLRSLDHAEVELEHIYDY